MTVELIGMIGVQREKGSPGAAVHVIGGGVDPAYLRDFARAHEEAGFDTVLVGYTSTSAEGFSVAGYAAAVTEHLRFLIAHRPEAAAPYGNTPRFSVSVRPILGRSEAQAWERARTILAQLPQQNRVAVRPQAVGSQRLLNFAAQGEVHDKRLWMPIAAATAAAGNTTALVGTPEQVAESFLDYYDAGATTLFIRGFDPLHDAREFGRELIPLVRAEVARRHTAVATEGTL